MLKSVRQTANNDLHNTSYYYVQKKIHVVTFSFLRMENSFQKTYPAFQTVMNNLNVFCHITAVAHRSIRVLPDGVCLHPNVNTWVHQHQHPALNAFAVLSHTSYYFRNSSTRC